MGTTFAKILADAATSSGVERRIRLWGRRAEVVEQINLHHRNPQYLADVELPPSITASTDVAAVLAGADLVVLAVPAQSLRLQLREWKPLLEPDALVVSLMKGLELSTDARMSEVICEELGIPASRIAVVSGPNLAMEIAREEPTASVVACPDSAVAGLIARSCTAPYFRPYTTTDIVGVEIGGIVKNVIALAVGICEGKQMGDNTKASVITRGSPKPRAWPWPWAAQPRPWPASQGWGTSSPRARPRCPGTTPPDGCWARASPWTKWPKNDPDRRRHQVGAGRARTCR